MAPSSASRGEWADRKLKLLVLIGPAGVQMLTGPQHNPPCPAHHRTQRSRGHLRWPLLVRSIHHRQFRHTQRQPFGAMAREVDLGAGIVARAFNGGVIQLSALSGNSTKNLLLML